MKIIQPFKNYFEDGSIDSFMILNALKNNLPFIVLGNW